MAHKAARRVGPGSRRLGRDRGVVGPPGVRKRTKENGCYADSSTPSRDPLADVAALPASTGSEVRRAALPSAVRFLIGAVSAKRKLPPAERSRSKTAM